MFADFPGRMEDGVEEGQEEERESEDAGAI